MNPDFLTEFGPFARSYNALLCDAWGVIHNGVRLATGIEEALVNFRRECGPVIILTNAPRPSEIIAPQLDRLGLSREAYDGVVTSGDATRAAIRELLPAPAFRMGPPQDDPLYKGIAVEFVSLDEAEFIVCTGLPRQDENEPEAHREELTKAAARGLPMICANPDIVVNWGGKILYCAGALAQIYLELGGEVIYGGKPHAPIYKLALEQARQLQRPSSAPLQPLAVGDGVKTDILGANAQQIDALFIAGQDGVYDGPSTARAAGEALAEVGGHAAAVMEALTW